jgi:hypothetical protein
MAIVMSAGLTLALSACGDTAAPPEPGEGAVGFVAVDNAGAGENPITPAIRGGPEGQTPDYPNPAGAPSVVYSDRGRAPGPPREPNAAYPQENIAHDAEAAPH